jgi:beta-lactamase class A
LAEGARKRARRLSYAGFIVAIALVTAGCSSPSPRAAPPRSTTTVASKSTAFVSTTVPDTQVGSQLTWFLGAVAAVPLSEQSIDAHFDSLFLGQVSPAKLNAALEEEFAAPSGGSLVGLLSEDPTSLVAVANFGTVRLKVTISVDGTGLIDGLLLAPAPAPMSWVEIDRQLAALGPHVSFLAARVSNGSCQPIHQEASATARPLGSEFKLFVLGALAHEVATGRVSWRQELTVEPALQSIGNAQGSGSLEFSPAGTEVSVQEAATKMISISDNTAADMLINLVGRSGVESQVRHWSSHAPLDDPFLTTRELFLLHYVNYPTLANEYLALAPSKRAAFLASSVDPLPLSEVQGSTQPRDIDSIEYFASPDDICRAFAGLRELSRQHALSPIGTIFSVNKGGLGLSPSRWPSVWFKGGSEAGVLTLGYLAQNNRGQTFVVSAMVSNPTTALAAASVGELVGITKGAFDLVG